MDHRYSINDETGQASPRCRRGCFCCFSSLRHLILILSFLCISSLFANMMLFSLVAVHYDSQLSLAPSFLRYREQKFNLPIPPATLSIKQRESSNIKTDSYVTSNGENQQKKIPLRERRDNTKTIVNRAVNANLLNNGIDSEEASHKLNFENIQNATHIVNAGGNNSTIEREIDRNLISDNNYSSAEKTLNFSAANFEKSYNGGLSQMLVSTTLMPDFKNMNRGSISNSTNSDINYVGVGVLEHIAHCLMFAAPGLGVLVAHFPAGLLLRSAGVKKTMALALLISSLMTAAFPYLVTEYGVCAVILIRFLFGSCFAPTLSFIGLIVSNWAKNTERHFFILICFSALGLSIVVSWRLSLALIYDLSWHSMLRVFGAHAALSFIILAVWLAIFVDTPQKHRLVNGIELNKIMSGRTQNVSNQPAARNIWRSISAWIVWLSAFAYFFVVVNLAHFLPFYVFRVLQQRLDYTVTIPFILLFIIHIAVYAATHFLQTTTFKLRVLNTIGFALSAIAFIALAIFPPHEQFVQRIIWLLWICVAPLGFSSGGFIESAVVCDREFSQQIITHLQIPLGMALFVSPFTVCALANSTITRQWRLIFLGCAAVLAITGAIFGVLGRGRSAANTSSKARWAWTPTVGKMRSLVPISETGDECGVLELRKIDPVSAMTRSNPQKTPLLSQE